MVRYSKSAAALVLGLVSWLSLGSSAQAGHGHHKGHGHHGHHGGHRRHHGHCGHGHHGHHGHGHHGHRYYPRGGPAVYTGSIGTVYQLYYRTDPSTAWTLYQTYDAVNDASTAATDLRGQGYDVFIR